MSDGADMHDLHQRRTRLSQSKQALLAKRLGGDATAAGAAPAIPRRAAEGNVPLSFSQQRLWFLDRVDPGSPAYNIPYAYRLRGTLQVDALQQALTGIVRRHEALRTTFSVVDGEPVQRIGAAAPVDLPLRDLGEQPEIEREEEGRRIALAEAHRPFDLEHGPLLRCRLLRMSPGDHLLLITVHHIVFDGWSDGVFFRELDALYTAIAGGSPAQLNEPPIQYADYAIWQRSFFRGDEIARQLSYWKKALDGIPPSLDLPADFKRPSVRTFQGRTITRKLRPEVHEALVAFGNRENVTLFMTLLAAFAVLLHRYSAQDDIVVGTPIAGRSRRETEDLIGFFVNTLVLRTDCSGDPAFRELLARVRGAALGAFEHQDLPFDKLVEELHPARHAGGAPLFQTLFVLQRLGGPPVKIGGLNVGDERPVLGAAKFDLTLSMQESEAGLMACLEYRTDLFGESTIRRMLRHLEALLASAVRNPGERISSLGMMEDAEERAILRFGRGHTAGVPAGGTFQNAFESVVRRTPDAPAVRFGGTELTYRELNIRANRVARVLRSMGARPDAKTGIMMDRSLDMAVALLGILKSGAAYLPVDSALPDGRLAYMLTDASVNVLLTQKKFLPRLPRTSPRPLCLDDAEFQGVLALQAPEDPDPVAGPGDLAYVIYTSGSTGDPKGVQVEHRSLLNHNYAVAGAFGITPSDRVLQFVSLSFDASVEDILPTWLCGAVLVLRSEDAAANMSRFLALVADERITILKLPTAFWHELAEHLADRPLPETVRLVTFGGEKALPGKLEAWKRSVGHSVRLMNLYGPTEGTVATTMYEARVREDGTLPIGRPLANTYVYLLDRHERPVPRGVPGEIYIGGAGVARGYLNNPALTSERFVQDPFLPREGRRLYRSGDLGRFLPDGNIEFIGRRDAQVKVRGYRIELGEIESVLSGHRAVKEAAVTAYTDQTGSSALAAYVVCRERRAGPEVFDMELKSWLRTRLPEYMVPAVFVELDALPLTPAGKIDRKSLLPPAETTVRSRKVFVPPRDELESQLAALWEQVLGRSPIGVFDDFFALGGHSLLAARLFARIERVLGRNLPLATLFQAPTIDQLSSILRAEGWRPRWPCLVPVKPGGSRPPFYCVHAAGGNVLGYSGLAEHLGPDQPVYGLQAVGLDGRELPQSRVEEMAARYIEEIRAFQPRGPYYIGGACTGGIVAFEIAHQLHDAGETVGILAMFDTFAHSYLKTLTKNEIRRYIWESSLERLEFHLRNLLLGPGRIGYIRRKSRTLRRRIETRAWGFLYRWYAIKRYPIPAALLKVEQFNVEAIRNYVPRPYPGRITLFPPGTRSVGEFRDREQGWGKLALGGVEIHDVTGDHLTMLQEPYVPIVAQELTECLERAYERHASPD